MSAPAALPTLLLRSLEVAATAAATATFTAFLQFHAWKERERERETHTHTHNSCFIVDPERSIQQHALLLELSMDEEHAEQ